ncbi:MAG: glycosidase [Ilumatobacteraceae bacterium]|nr:glycosidase [Ilumatobacteraceae bacterium]
MRTYRIGAILLDLDHPERIIADLPTPILEATPDERDGYVPNVVYSCGGLLHRGHLVVPFGVADQRTAFTTFVLDDLIDALLDHRASSIDPAGRSGG